MTYCEDDEYYALNILHNKSRKIYFDNYNQMIAFLDKALMLQNFYTRLSQYQDLEQLESHDYDPINVKRVLSMHKVTGTKYIIKSVDTKKGNIAKAKNE